MKFHPDVLRCHEQFGGDLEDMQRRYDASDALAAKDTALSEMRAELERVKMALRDQSCPRPCNHRPDDFSIGECSDAGECGCGAARALASQDDGEER